MLLFLRLIPFLAAFFAWAGSALAASGADWTIAGLIGGWVTASLAVAVLVRTAPVSVRSWAFVGIPALFLGTGMLFFLFLESAEARFATTFFLAAGTFLWTDHLFFYLHAPAGYRVNSLENVILVLVSASIFFLATAGFSAILFLQGSAWLVGGMFFASLFALLAATWWVCKMDPARRVWVALGEAFVLAQWFVALSFLPSVPFVNACLVAIAAYVLLGLQRTDLLRPVTRRAVLRYAAAAAGLAVVVVGTARWW